MSVYLIIPTDSSNPYERYDPTKSDHAKLEVQLEDRRSTKKNKKNNDSSDSSESDSDEDLANKKKKKKNVEDQDTGPVVPEVKFHFIYILFIKCYLFL